MNKLVFGLRLHQRCVQKNNKTVKGVRKKHEILVKLSPILGFNQPPQMYPGMVIEPEINIL